MHLLTFLQILLINIHILDTPIVSFHKYDKILATDLPLVFYLVHIIRYRIYRKLPRLETLETHTLSTS